ncbi:MAG: hypothetical protein AOA66_0491 [Candidatus Bathyarchaeota archaeon BA2]|nr:MAG: hypothetical protein AOA66_0491 [Candidatus Bathyarchaeota archaeon BA2]
MLLVDQKASGLLFKINFAREEIAKIKSPDEILINYLEDLKIWLNKLENQVRKNQELFKQFVTTTNFIEKDHLRDEPQRRLLADILRVCRDVERDFYLGVDAFLPLISVWFHQRSDEGTRRQHKLLVSFIQDMLKLSNIPEVTMVILGETHACLPLYWGKTTRHIVFATLSEIKNLRRWGLLAHEMGHAFYDLNFEEFYLNVIPQVIRKLAETKPINIKPSEFEDTIYIWATKWVPELAADCFAIKNMGPSFLTQFMLIALDSEPDRVEPSHPPTNLRVKFMIDVLESLELSDVNVESYRNIWDAYSRSVSHPSSRYILNEEVVNEALNGINSIVQDSPIKNKWNDIFKAREFLSQGMMPDKDLISIVSATALVDPTINLCPIYETLLERYASNHDSF